jgi:hypothetical protein
VVFSSSTDRMVMMPYISSDMYSSTTSAIERPRNSRRQCP